MKLAPADDPATLPACLVRRIVSIADETAAMDLHGVTALVTGGAAGIGAGIEWQSI